MSAELKPCPFCSGSASSGKETASRWSVYCLDCDAEMVGALTEERAVEAWNRRALAAPSQPAEPVAQAEQQPTFAACAKCVAPDHCSFFTCVAEEPDMPSHPAAEQAVQQPALRYGPNKTPWRISDDRKELVDCEGNRIARLTSLDMPNAEFIVACVNAPTAPFTEQQLEDGLRAYHAKTGLRDITSSEIGMFHAGAEFARALLARATGEGKS